jgi:HAD superfamily hydrolase (TIGR01509 family)
MTPSVFVFDLFGVVVSFDDSIVYRRIAEFCDDPDRAMPALKDLVSCPRLITGQITLLDIHSWLVEDFGLSLTPDEFNTLWREPYSASMPGMGDILKALHSNYQLLLLSNVDAYYWPTLRARHPDLEYFNKFLLSCELGLAKPDGRIFAHTAATAEAAPGDCFFVDDKPVFVEAARSCGFNAHLFQGVPELRKTLRHIGVKEL